jgi:hypothetical protein
MISEAASKPRKPPHRIHSLQTHPTQHSHTPILTTTGTQIQPRPTRPKIHSTRGDTRAAEVAETGDPITTTPETTIDSLAAQAKNSTLRKRKNLKDKPRC